MASGSINVSIPSIPRDFGKKKRANRSAKLKQCKLDARREQWLSQVKNKGCKEELMGPRVSPQQIHEEERKNALENLQMRRRGGGVGVGEDGNGNGNENGSIHHDYDLDSPLNSPTGSSVLGGNESGTNFTASSSSSTTSGSSVGGSITEEDGEENDNCLDDWEAMADALAANDDDNKLENHFDENNPCLELQSSLEYEPAVQLDCDLPNLGFQNENLTQERKVPPRVTPGNSRAWRPDDALRPQSLPDLPKQRSFKNIDRHYGQGVLPWGCASGVNVPTSCPICTEDLDLTDTSFLPCSCGFQVCLFCHKKMLELDGRCPNCRELYKNDPVKVETSVRRGSLTLRLARSCSMRS
ncbi:RING/U-BOX SUPERFAMILY PROTEIN [Salix viminalis]|uniref:RING/U-BOX SUPERFAMILY PROTEIN n=1 Tax=Salix viminalis TaxID=40686 RepID=A0A9Q0NVL9_SALVM|nr:RING/U-BOX SUPERFAMILY PROTEIN [Salix viminalis]